MTKSGGTDFDDWFDTLVMLLSDKNINFRDRDAVKDDYEDDKDVYDVVDEIVAEYGE